MAVRSGSTSLEGSGSTRTAVARVQAHGRLGFGRARGFSVHGGGSGSGVHVAARSVHGGGSGSRVRAGVVGSCRPFGGSGSNVHRRDSVSVRVRPGVPGVGERRIADIGI